jgi:hypothetical protein
LLEKAPAVHGVIITPIRFHGARRSAVRYLMPVRA